MASNTGQIARFPNQAVPDKEKASLKYGLEVGRAIQEEWFRRDSGAGRFQQQQVAFHRLRKYARGEQSTQIYKDILSIDGDLSYINLDWTPVHIIPKFIDIVVNGMQDRLFHIKALAQDPISTERRTKFVQDIERDMLADNMLTAIQAETGMNVRNFPKEELPSDTEELSLYMQLQYKQGIEIAIEQGIDNVMMSNKYDQLKRRLDMDLVTLGIAAAKHTFNGTDGIKLDYVDPSDLIWSYTEDPNFEDCYYFGEIKRVRVNELKREFPHLTLEQLEEIKENGAQYDYTPTNYDYQEDSFDSNTVNVLYFNWKSWENDVYKVKETSTGAQKIIPKDDTFDPPKDFRAKFSKVSQIRECIYEGAMVVNTEIMLKWEKAKNMVRPDSNANKVMMNYVVSAPKIYKGRIESLCNRMITYADQIQIAHLKLQQAIQKMTPSGVALNVDALVDIDLGNGMSYTPKEALNMYFQTGSIVMRSMNSEGDPTGQAPPIQELPGGGGQQIELLINTYNYYLNMIRDVTGINEARDGGDPDPYSLVGVQKLAAANSNTATRHVLNSSMFITTCLAEACCIRFKDVLEFHPQKEKFISSIGRFSVGSLEELDNLHIHDFGIFLDLEPDEEEKQLLEANIQAALQRESIHLEDANDVRNISNLKLANQLLKYRRQRKQQQDQQVAERNIQVQNEQQTQGAIAVEEAKQKAKQMETEMDIQLETTKSQLEIKKLEVDKLAKIELMQKEFEFNQMLKQMELSQARKMQGDKLQADAAGKPPSDPKPSKGFESKGNDVLGSIDLSKYEPK